MTFTRYEDLWYVAILILVTGASGLQLSEPSNRIECSRSKIDHNVTLANDLQPGKFIKHPNKRITMKQCLSKCCKIEKCDVALLKNRVCYSVTCDDIEACIPVANKRNGAAITISFVAKPQRVMKGLLVSDSQGEPERSEELDTEFEPLASHGSLGDVQKRYEIAPKIRRLRQRTKREWKDLILAVGCATIAVTMGVIGVIYMTRQLVEDDGYIAVNDKKY